MRYLALLLICIAATAHAADTLPFTSPPDTSCGNASSGACIVLEEATQSYRLFWYWNGATGNLQLTQRDASGLTLATFNAKLTSSPREGVDNVMLTDAFGNAVTVSYTGHTGRKLIRSGHNYYVYATYVDAGTLTR